jgi:hypothetical protein
VTPHSPMARVRSNAAIATGYWTITQLAAYLGCSRWTVQRRVKADPLFPVLDGWGGSRFPVERVRAYLERQERGRGRAYKTREFLRPAPQPTATAGAGPAERPS